MKSNRPQLSLAPVVVGTPQPDGVTTPSGGCGSLLLSLKHGLLYIDVYR